MNGISWVASVMCRNFLISPPKSRLLRSLSTVQVHVQLRLRLVEAAAAGAVVLDDGNWHTCKKRAVALFPRLDGYLYLGLRHLLEVIGQSPGSPQPAAHLACRGDDDRRPSCHSDAPSFPWRWDKLRNGVGDRDGRRLWKDRE